MVTATLTKTTCSVCGGDGASRVMVVCNGKSYCLPCWAMEYPHMAKQALLWLEEHL